jgi:hypothetical protein
MSARDAFHYIVRSALEKDGWNITDDPLYISFGRVDIEIDLAAEKLLAAERQGEKIALEVKSFLAASAITEFHKALGQYINYRTMLELDDPERILYLAVPLFAYNNFFTRPFVQIIIQKN